MVAVEPCKGCGRTLFMHRVANLVVRLEIEPLDAAKATEAILAGRELWRATSTGITPARPAELDALRMRGNTEGPHIVATHRCTAVSAPPRPSPVPSGQPTPHRPPAGRATRSSGPQAAPSSARSAASRRSDLRSHPCDTCRKPVILDGPELYMAMELGATVLWAIHDGCGKEIR